MTFLEGVKVKSNQLTKLNVTLKFISIQSLMQERDKELKCLKNILCNTLIITFTSV